MAASRRILLLLRAISAGKPLHPPAWTYDDVVGEIWMMEVGAYDNAPTGQISVRDPSGTNGGYYDNRE